MGLRPHKSGAALNIWTWHFFCDVFLKSSSHYSLLHILPASCSKSALNASVRFLCEIELSPRPVHFCRPHLPKVPRGRQFFNILKRKPSPRYSPVSSHASELLHFPTTWWWVVGMMMWYDVVGMMVEMLTMTIARNSEVFYQNFLWSLLMNILIAISDEYDEYIRACACVCVCVCVCVLVTCLHIYNYMCVFICVRIIMCVFVWNKRNHACMCNVYDVNIHIYMCVCQTRQPVLVIRCDIPSCVHIGH